MVLTFYMTLHGTYSVYKHCLLTDMAVYGIYTLTYITTNRHYVNLRKTFLTAIHEEFLLCTSTYVFNKISVC